VWAKPAPKGAKPYLVIPPRSVCGFEIFPKKPEFVLWHWQFITGNWEEFMQFRVLPTIAAAVFAATTTAVYAQDDPPMNFLGSGLIASK
jgi:hypothetical protein